jgi:hypothetical protein
VMPCECAGDYFFAIFAGLKFHESDTSVPS